MRKAVSEILMMPPQWSFSRWGCYEQCPRKAKLQYIDGYREDEKDAGPAAKRGTDIHGQGEAFLKAKRLTSIPPIFQFFAKEVKELYRLKAVAEIELGLTRDWKPCAFDSKDYWWHGAIDAAAYLTPTKAWGVDWKSGKIYDKHKLQLELYALAMFLHDEALDEILMEDFYVDKKKKASNTYKHYQVPTLIKLWERRVTPMFADREFAPCPSNLCAWCPFTKEKGSGLCEY